MAIVGGLDIHRRQITYDWIDTTTGWRFVVEELERAGFRAHLAEPADTRVLRDPKRRAKTDRTDALHRRELLRAGTLPESLPPSAHI